MEGNPMEWTIAEVASSAGVSSRTLRHYDAVGLLKPSSVASNGYRFYGQSEVLRLQQILAFRELGLSLADISAILDADVDPIARLEDLSLQFADSIERIQRQRESIHRAISSYRKGEAIVPTELFDGFDHTEYQQEVEERWGNQAYAEADAWWSAMTDEQRNDWRAVSDELASAWTVAAGRGIEPESDLAQELAARQNLWLSSMSGTPGSGSGQADSDYLLGLGELYVADERFAANYGGLKGAEFVAAALRVFVERREGLASA